MSDQITNKLPFNNVPYFSGTNRSSREHFLSLLNSASKEIIFFGLTCGFYLSKPTKKIIIQKSHQIPIKILILHPQSIHRKSRYELEPTEAKYHDANYFKESVIEQYRNLKSQCDKSGKSQLEIYLYDFMPVFGLELIDDTIRVRLYGYMKRGIDSPIFVLSRGADIFRYFENQIRSILKIDQLIPIESI
jgi:hypothetical protein